MPEEEKELAGVCEFFTESGTEGGYWAFHDNIGKDPDGVHWSYEGLRVLKDGDRLTIYDREDKNKIVWSGEISLIQYPVFSQSIFNYWIHSDQKNVSRTIWARWFFEEYPAKLIPAKKK